MECQAEDLTIREVGELLADYQRIVGILNNNNNEG